MTNAERAADVVALYLREQHGKIEALTMVRRTRAMVVSLGHSPKYWDLIISQLEVD